MDTNRQYRQDELPSDVFNSNNGDIRSYNGQQVKVINNGNGTRSLISVGGSGGGGGGDPVATQAAINAEIVKENQPAIATLQGRKGDLDTQYKEILDSITAGEQPAVNATTLATNNELGKRGISGDSSLAQQQIAGAIAPVTAQFQGLRTGALTQKTQDLGNLASAIASLQAGNPTSSAQFATNLTGIQNQTAAQIQAANIAAAGQLAAAQAQPKYIFGPNQNTAALNTATGKLVAPSFSNSSLNNSL